MYFDRNSSTAARFASANSQASKISHRSQSSGSFKFSNTLLLPIFLIFGGLVSALRSQDANWDLLNYHYYNAWALLHNRQGVDCFVSFIQSYFDPALDIPFYLLVSSPLGSFPRIVSAIIGLQYGLILFIAYLISDMLSEKIFANQPVERYILTILSVTLAGGGAALWAQIGTTTNEIPISILLLLSFLFF